MIPPNSSPSLKCSSGSFSGPLDEGLEPQPSSATTFCLDENALWKQAVLLWMEWHQAQERLTAAMFRSRHDTAQQAELMQQMDQLDQLRWRAVELSQEMLSHSGE